MQRIKRIDQMLQAWAEWRLGASCGYRSPAYDECDVRYTDDPVNSYVEFSLEQEAIAMRMDKAVAALPTELSRTVVAAYTWEGGLGTLCEKLRVTRATVHRRLCHADIRIDAWLQEQDAIAVALRKQGERNNFASYTG